MAPSHNAFWSIAVTLALFATLPMVVAHGGGGSVADEHGTDTHAHASHENVVEQMNESEYPPTYFSHPEYAGLIYAHIVLMSLAWIIILPLGKYVLASPRPLPGRWLVHSSQLRRSILVSRIIGTKLS